jgi:hypothetical protein
MKPANSVAEIDSNDEIVKACISAPDVNAAKPLREYLESAGIKTYLNNFEISNPVYTIIVGPMNFVKDILAMPNVGIQKLLIIIWSEPSLKPKILNEYNAKIILIDDSVSLPKKIKEIFSFFFISSDQLLELRTPEGIKRAETIVKPEIVQPKPKIEQPLPKSIARSRAEVILSQDFSEEKIETDKKRINDTITQVYGKLEIEKPVKHKIHHRPKINFISGLIILFCIFIVPSVWYVICLLISGTTLYISAINLEKGNIDLSKTSATISDYWQNQARGTLTVAKIPARLIFQERIFQAQEGILSFLNDATGAIISTNSIAQTGRDFIKSMTGQLYGSVGQSQSTAIMIDEFKTQLPYIHDRLGLASAQLRYLISVNSFPVSFQPIRIRAGDLLNKLDASRSQVDFLENLLTLYASAAGFDNARTYLILLQNSTELRPTGGFIGSIALASVHDGFIKDLKVEDVYDADGQLKGHADPPLPIRQILGEEHWYLRDSNWNPDFSQSGKTAAWFYQKETNQAVDGVIAISSPFLIDILKATGPITLTDYKDQITAENFYGKSLYYIQSGFFPGSTQKKNFLGSLLNAIILRITENKNINQVLLLKSFQTALNSHDVMLYFPKPQLEQLTEQFGWAGSSINSKTCIGIRNPKICQADFVGTVEANLSVNKVNYFIERNKMTQVEINSDGTVTDSVAINFSNNSEDKNGQGGGVYRNYERFYLPVDAQISQIMINGQNIPVRNPNRKDIGLVPYAEYDMTSASKSATILGVAIDVKPKEKSSLVISYKHMLTKPQPEQPVVYELFQPIQPGIGSISGKTIIRLPSSWIFTPDTTPTKTTLLANVTQLEYNTVTDKDDIIRINIQANKGE